MKDKLRNKEYKLAVIIGTIFYGLTITLHILILTKIVPLSWISGGRVTSYDMQIYISGFNFLLCCGGLGFLWLVRQQNNTKVGQLVALGLSVLWFIGLSLQLFGTPFEKFIISWLLLLGIISHVQLFMLGKRSSTN